MNYVHWNFLSQLISATTSEMRELYDAWENAGESDDEDEEKQETDDKKKRFDANFYIL